MAFNVITSLQLAVFVVILFNINLHSASAGSKESSAHQSSHDSIKAQFLRYKLCKKYRWNVEPVQWRLLLCTSLGNDTERSTA
uniref:Putative secreted protein n=1 Tax=Ixodes ricinus TaxID=34613 RepID=A0A090XER4_IXORI